MVEHQPMAGGTQPRVTRRGPGSGSAGRPASRSPRQPGGGPGRRPAPPPAGAAALPWVAVIVFTLVGAGIVYKLIQSAQNGRAFAVVLEGVFGLLWLFIAVAYGQDLRKRSAARP